LVLAIRQGHPGATAALFDRHAAHVQRVLARILGVDHELADLLQDVFVAALEGIDELREPSQLRGWLTRIAVFVARGCIRKRVRRRWLRFFDDVPEIAGPPPADEARDALAGAYRVLSKLPPDLRIPFSLRFIDQMELTEVAAACDVSLATIKRRLSAAQKAFLAHAKSEPAVLEALDEGDRLALGASAEGAER
jgi:RNA polymerase sigma-70 factor (ECF subfamily)